MQVILRPLDGELRESVERIVEYLYEDEKKHWEELGNPNNHIFLDVKRLAEELHQ